ncbi:hypothetical protein TrST_g11967 [Triparma strigata]|uniref:Mediator of RNA polymerase II transcription subunit 31 n=1 Tax=Triparma strigata TaxID=1606541 RepID=A0A9W7B8Y6_9STRA|nr:hypothetical protein TrST_g11967 [Triparma strigata]
MSAAPASSSSQPPAGSATQPQQQQLYSNIPYPKSDVFLSDLEFLQSLSQPSYLRHLSITPPFVLQSLSFQLYLLYLYKTYSTPRYRVHVIYPLAFEYLKLLVHPDVVAIANGTMAVPRANDPKARTDYATKFSNSISAEPFRDQVHSEQFAAWKWRVTNVYGKGEDMPKPPPPPPEEPTNEAPTVEDAKPTDVKEEASDATAK